MSDTWQNDALEDALLDPEIDCVGGHVLLEQTRFGQRFALLEADRFRSEPWCLGGAAVVPMPR